MTRKTGEGVHYGHKEGYNGFELGEKEREQLGLLVEIVKDGIEPNIKNEKWLEFQKIEEESRKRGELITLSSPPGWLVDGGKNAKVKKTKNEQGEVRIEVPSDIYNLYYWKDTVEKLKKEIIDQSDEMLKGRSTNSLNERLRNILFFCKKNGLVD